MTTVIAVASGPSFTEEQAQLIDAAHRAGKVRLAVVNENWRRFPDADALYAADPRWWNVWHAEVLANFRGECWTGTAEIARKYGLCFKRVDGGPHARGLSTDPSYVVSGNNGGYQLIGHTRHWLHADDDPVKQMILVAYDMQHTGGRAHHHADYSDQTVDGRVIRFTNASGVAQWARAFPALAAGLKTDGIDVVNCTISTALECFPRADLAETLAAL